MGLWLNNVDKIVGKEVHLKDIDLELESGSRNVLLGRTLAGKTSLLRVMAGLDRPSKGSVHIDDRDVTGVSVRKRSVAMVYQQFINFPSLTVYENIASPLKIARVDKKEIDARVRKTAEMLQIDRLLDRLPVELSGGQQQRTAIARALIKETDLLLLDEPLVNLDYKLREELRLDLQEIFQERRAIVVYTTTEPAEALMLGGNVIVMDEGRILQTGPTPEVYHHPATLKVADVFSDPPINYLPGTISGGKALLVDRIEVPLASHMNSLDPGEYTFAVRSNHLFLSRQREGEREVPCQVELSEINGSETFIHVNLEQTRMVIQEDGIHQRKMGSKINIYLDPDRLFAYGPQGDLVASPARNTH